MLFSKHIKIFTLEQQQKIVSFLINQLPRQAEFYERLQSIRNFRSGEEQQEFLQKLYFETETELVKSGGSRWASPAMIRQKIRAKWRFDDYLPTPFLLAFLSEEKQVFWMFADLVMRLLVHLNWEFMKVQALFTELGRDTFLSKVALRDGKIEWDGAFAAFTQQVSSNSRRDLEENFGKAIRRLYRELIFAFGTERARTFVEQMFRAMKRDYGFLDTLSTLLVAMPEGVLKEERYEFYPKKELQEELRSRMLELEGTNVRLLDDAQKLKKSIDELEGARAKMQLMQGAQADFIRVVSHQFRTPLSVIRWQAEIATDFVSHKDGIPPELHDALAAIHEKSVFLADVLNNVFDLLAIESGLFFLNKKPAAIWEILEDSRRDHLRPAEQKRVGIVFKKKELPTEECAVDPEKFRRVADTFIGNAVLYSQEGSNVIIKLEKIQEGGTEVFHAFVRDEGIGVSPDEKDRIFDKFFRGKEAVKYVPDGAGLGLYIAKHIIEAHGGRIWVESEGPGKGSTFHLIVPKT